LNTSLFFIHNICIFIYFVTDGQTVTEPAHTAEGQQHAQTEGNFETVNPNLSKEADIGM
jgi:hypothetical protein